MMLELAAPAADTIVLAPPPVELAEIETVQVNIHDPDGNHLHIDFSTTEDG